MAIATLEGDAPPADVVPVLARVRLVVIAVTAVAAVSLLVAARLELGRTSADVAEARQALATEEARLDHRRDEVTQRQAHQVALEPQLREARTRLARVEQALGARTAERDGIQRSVDGTRREAEALQASIVSTFDQLAIQGVQVHSLQRCLAGVIRALNRASLDDADGALRSLQRSAGDCRAAQADLADQAATG